MSGMIRAFFDNARLLGDTWGIAPLMYGSLGLEYLTGKPMQADDIDILIPGVFVSERWDEFKGTLEAAGYSLIDEHEHTFEKDGIHYSYARLEELQSFCGILVEDIPRHSRDGVRFLLLNLNQYLRVYRASSQDGYRVNVRSKKDHDKIRFIESELNL